jgi:hypothetical protein
MYRKLLPAMVFSLVMLPTLFATAVEEKQQKKLVSIHQETMDERIARLQKESQTPEAIQARENFHRSMMDDPLYRKQHEEFERMKGADSLQPY